MKRLFFNFEHKRQELLAKHLFLIRVLWALLFMVISLTICLGVVVLGYHFWGPMSWIDSLHNASMILSGMGPVIDAGIVLSKSAKVFASTYAIFSGVSFLSVFSIAIAPVLHRVFHRFHLEDAK
jgi:asparagine N-glycosylation enzyme membrane subunit Stt3